MIKAASCFSQDIGVQVSTFLRAYDAYRTVESRAQDMQEINPQYADEIRDERPHHEAGMERAMGKLAELRDEVTAALDSLLADVEAAAAEYGEGSPEHEEHDQRYQAYLDVGEEVQAAADRVLGLWDTRDEP